MEAIIVILVAAFDALFRAVFALLEIMMICLSLTVEFLVVLLTRGRAEALTQTRQSWRQSRETRAGATARRVDPRNRRLRWVLAAAVLIVPVGFIAWDQIQRSREQATKADLESLADDFATSFKNNPKFDVQPGELPQRDAWSRPCELLIDKMAVGKFIAVRSLGRDGKPTTGDDLFATRFVPIDPKRKVAEAIKRGGAAVGARLKALFDRPDPVADEADK